MTARRPLRLGLLLALTLISRLGATWAAPPERIGVLFVNAKHEWTRTLQERWEAAGPFIVPGFETVPADRLLRAEATAHLPAAQRDRLTRFPEMLLASSRNRLLFDARYVVITRFDKPEDGRTVATIHDLSTGAQINLPRLRERDLKASMEALSSTVGATLTRLGAPVWGHVTAKIYHIAGCDHVRQDQTIAISSAREASQNGYAACTVCFEAEAKGPPRNSTERTLGREVSSYIERQYRLDTDTERRDRVERVGRRLVETNGLSDFTYTFRVLDVETPNAFAAGAGSVYITRGLERLTAGNDDMLAAVLGHEIGHSEEHHVLRQYRQAQTWAVLGTIASVATGVYWPGLLADFVGGLLGRGNGRVHELEADRLGVVYAYSAGYRADDFILVMNALKKVGSGRSTPNWLRTHPTEDKRLERTRALVAQLEALDKIAVSYATIDGAAADWIRRNSRFFYEHPQDLAEGLDAWTIAVRPLPAPSPTAADDSESETEASISPSAIPSPSPTAASDGTRATTSQGLGAPTERVPADTNDGLRVAPGSPDEPPRFIHD